MALEHKKHEDFSEWYLEAVQKAQLMDYAPTQGAWSSAPILTSSGNAFKRT